MIELNEEKIKKNPEDAKKSWKKYMKMTLLPAPNFNLYVQYIFVVRKERLSLRQLQE